MINSPQTLLESLEVKLLLACRIESPPQLLDALVALVLSLHRRVELRSYIRDLHSRLRALMIWCGMQSRREGAQAAERL
jgi:hypothetical protein